MSLRLPVYNSPRTVEKMFPNNIALLRFALASFLLATSVICPLAGQDSPGVEESITLTYMGTAAWQISDGTTVILIDPISHE